ncbi:MAG: hypothetical protein FJZ90_06065 [Chloroflexi bacterium]|nr:hypothetical protein [Chloroflexota bacterium]
MADAPVITIVILGGAALGFVLWETLASRRTGTSGRTSVALVAIALAFAATASPWPTLPWAGSLSLRADALSRVLTGLALGLAGLALLLSEDGEEFPLRPPRHGPRLLALCGAVLALSASDLLSAVVGLTLFLVATMLDEGFQGREALRTAHLVGLACSVFGVALLYTAMGSFDLGLLAQHLWTRAMPMPPMFGAGVGLLLGGIILATGLIPPSGHGSAPSSPISLVLGIGLVSHLCAQPFVALSSGWSQAFYLSGGGLMALGSVLALRALSVPEGLERLTIAQRGFLLFTVPLAVRQEGVSLWLGALVAVALAQTLWGACLQRLTEGEEPGGNDVRGAVRAIPWLGAPLLIATLAMAILPFTSGLYSYLYGLWADGQGSALGEVLPGAIGSLGLVAAHLILSYGLLSPWDAAPDRRRLSWWTKGALILGTLALIVSLAYSTPFEVLARWITGFGG